MMKRALALASKGRFTTHPNPNVGCVIVNPQGQVIGQGWHQQAGGPHAEVHALMQAQQNTSTPSLATQGATVYVTLEPCSHHGRTGPCAQALIQAEVARVVIAKQDTNPEVSGRGIQMLQEAGIQVDVGLYEQKSTELNAAFHYHSQTGLPYIRVKLAATLDGKTALSNGESKWITNAQSRANVQAMRAQSMAILTGADTVLVDNPRLNVRLEQLQEDIDYAKDQADMQPDQIQQPVRVIIDTQGRVPLSATIFQDQVPCILVRTKAIEKDYPAHVKELIIPEYQGKADLKAMMQALGRQGIRSVWTEAGAHLAGALIERDLVQELWMYWAPKLLGHQAKPLVVLPVYQTMEAIPHFTLQHLQMLGDNIRAIYYYRRSEHE